MKDVGEMKHFLGISVERNMSKGILTLHQIPYLRNLLQRFGMSDCKGASTPIESHLKLTRENAVSTTSKPYKELIGCLMYATTTTRPDLSAAVNYFSQFQVCAAEEHWTHLRRVLRYIKQTLDLKLTYIRSDNKDVLIGFADADYANDINDRKSISGYVFKSFNSVISWATRKQSTVSLSLTEAEFISLSTAACEAIWINSVLQN